MSMRPADSNTCILQGIWPRHPITHTFVTPGRKDACTAEVTNPQDIAPRGIWHNWMLKLLPFREESSRGEGAADRGGARGRKFVSGGVSCLKVDGHD